MWASAQYKTCTEGTLLLVTWDTIQKAERRAFPGGPLVKNQPSCTGEVVDWGTELPYATGQLSLCASYSAHVL